MHIGISGDRRDAVDIVILSRYFGICPDLSLALGVSIIVPNGASLCLQKLRGLSLIVTIYPRLAIDVEKAEQAGAWSKEGLEYAPSCLMTDGTGNARCEHPRQRRENITLYVSLPKSNTPGAAPSLCSDRRDRQWRSDAQHPLICEQQFCIVLT
jgi:hypothetical protein